MSPAGGGCAVLAALPAYMAAIAELPLSAELTDDVSGAVAVVQGSGDWWQAMLAARAGGAVAVVLADPAVLPREALVSHPWTGDIPVIVERPRLRPDVVADAVAARRGSPARIITVECVAPSSGFEAVVRDGFGWARSLAQGPLSLKAGTATSRGRMALLDFDTAESGPSPATLVGTTVGGLHARGLLKVLALGEVRTDLTIDQPAGLTRLETSREEGALRAPDRYESSARLALRRAIQARSEGIPVTDLGDLLEDMALTWDLLAS
ncbi:hypothetical protein F8G81_03515 [Arthrobacter sp. CDRTa11]|uniref:hypothetical protein n=1 Tax=Arthrobacter sp. CDRTa11 TaxID=2651199 RepID=UPI002265BE8A|nr:hypothetical protein [Arthrobacter sp. CDRTa11]UZX01796.1 hypothetical protein F8G81_03515 [Arthrobacter sp. CDRTa11]